MQPAATHCNALQYSTTHCSTGPAASEEGAVEAKRCNMLQHDSTRYSTGPAVAEEGAGVVEDEAARLRSAEHLLLQCVAVCCSELGCAAPSICCCGLLQRVAVVHSVL